MIYELLKNHCEIQGWYFDYGRRDFLNLLGDPPLNESGEPFETLVLCDPITEVLGFSDAGLTESVTCSGSMLVLKSSDVDEVSYTYRRDNYIEPIKAQVMALFNSFVCNNSATIVSVRVVEVVNVLDYNGDGVVVDYSIKFDA